VHPVGAVERTDSHLDHSDDSARGLSNDREYGELRSNPVPVTAPSGMNSSGPGSD